MRRMNVSQLAAHLQTAEPLMIDVREPWEFDICHIEGSINIPMGQIAQAVEDIDSTGETVVICHHGIRSQQVIQYLRQHDIKNLINLDGGVDAWARDVDPSMPVY